MRRNDPLGRWFTFAMSAAVLCGFALFCMRDLARAEDQTYKLIGSFYASGWAAAHHLNPYALYPLTWQFPVQSSHGPIVIHDVNLSPPAMLPLLEWMTRFTVPQAAVLCTWVSTLLFLASALVLIVLGKVQKRVIVWLLISRYVLLTLRVGEDYSLLLFLACVVWALMRTRHWTAAYVVAGILIAFKPNLGLWPILLLLTRRWKPAIISSATAAVLSVIPMLRYGPSVYLQWLRASEAAPHWMFPSDVSLIGICTRVGMKPLGLVLAVACGAALMWLVQRLRPNDGEVAGIAVGASVLCAPLGWYHYAMLAAPFLAERRWKAWESAAAFLIWLPPIYELEAAGAGGMLAVLSSLPHLAGVVLLLAVFMRWAAEPNELALPRAENEHRLGPREVGV